MVELGELQKTVAKFEDRNARIYVVSIEDSDTAAKSVREFPGLRVVADTERKMAEAFQVIHPGSAPGSGDSSAPTTILVDAKGQVRWTFRPERHLKRLSPDELLAAVDAHLK
jgi:peroxiredoxin